MAGTHQTRSVYFPADVNDWIAKHKPEGIALSVFIGNIIRAEMQRRERQAARRKA